MVKQNKKISLIHMIGLELKRGLSEKRFWISLGIVCCFLILACVVQYLYTLTFYYNGDIEGEYSVYMSYNTVTRSLLFISGLGSTLFISYFPFFSVFAYGYSKIDDRKNKYDMQIVGRVGFFHYYLSKASAVSLLGGFYCGCIPFFFALLIEILYNRNPFLQSAVSYFKQREIENPPQDFTIYFYQKEIGVIRHYWSQVFYVTVMLFITGLVFAFLGFLVSLFIENKILFYAFPVFFLQFWDRFIEWVSSAYYRSHHEYLHLYLFLKEMMPQCNNLSYLCALGIIFAVSFFLAVFFYPKAEEKYREGSGI